MRENDVASPVDPEKPDVPKRRWGKHRTDALNGDDQDTTRSKAGYPNDPQGLIVVASAVGDAVLRKAAPVAVACPVVRSALLLDGGACHVQGLFVSMASAEGPLYKQLLAELKQREEAEARSRGAYWRIGTAREPGVTRVRRSEHLAGYPVHAEVIRRLSRYFGVKVEGWWVNHYGVGSAEKRMHRDGWGRQRGVNITVGASFGATRTLRFESVEKASGRNGSREVLDCPQEDGDVLAFGEKVNQNFRHGVPGEPGAGPRISVIIMGHAPAGWESRSAATTESLNAELMKSYGG